MITKKTNTTQAVSAKSGETAFIRRKLGEWGVKSPGVKTLEAVLPKGRVPCNVRLTWADDTIDIWRALGRGLDIRRDGAVFEQKLRQAMDQWEKTGIPRDFCGVVFRVQDHEFIYATEEFPRFPVTSPDEKPHPVPTGHRQGGLVYVSAGECATRRCIFPEHLADYAAKPKK